jgi:hypothetical protein
VKGKFILSINGHPQMRENLQKLPHPPRQPADTLSKGHVRAGGDLLMRDD